MQNICGTDADSLLLALLLYECCIRAVQRVMKVFEQGYRLKFKYIQIMQHDIHWYQTCILQAIYNLFTRDIQTWLILNNAY